MRPDCASPRVLFLLKWRAAPYSYGGDASWGEDADPARPSESGLCNSARMACEMLKRLGITARLAHCIDGDFIHREAVAFNATHVIIEAFWVTPAKFDELGRVLPDVRFIVRNHSETPFLANEGIAFQWTLEYLRRPHLVVAPNSPRMAEETRYLAGLEGVEGVPADEIERRVPLLTNYYGIREEPPRPLDETKSHVDIRCFGAIRPMKNQVIQALAAMRFADQLGKPLTFHVNGGRVENGGEPVLKSLRSIFFGSRHTLREHGWLSHQDFLTLMLSMDLVTQVSFSETFNIVAADAASEGVPVIASPEIPWASPLLQASPNDCADIARKMAVAWDMKRANPSFNPGLDGLRAYNDATRRRWADYFAAPLLR